MYTHLEDYIRDFLKSINIHNPPDLTIENISNKLHLKVTYKKKAFRHDNEIILQPGTKQQEWQVFAHELCHYLRHTGMQLMMHKLFIDLQEYQANHFAYHFCVPTFMLDKLYNYTIFDIMHLFNVEYDFAVRRFEMYQSKTLLGGDRYERACR